MIEAAADSAETAVAGEEESGGVGVAEVGVGVVGFVLGETVTHTATPGLSY